MKENPDVVVARWAIRRDMEMVLGRLIDLVETPGVEPSREQSDTLDRALAALKDAHGADDLAAMGSAVAAMNDAVTMIRDRTLAQG